MSDKELVKTVVLSNNDRFYFSRKYDKKLIDDEMMKVREIYASFQEIPLLPQQAKEINDDIIIDSIYGTAKIEGNPLSEEDFRNIYSDRLMIYNNRAFQEIENLKTLYRHLKENPENSLLNENEVIP